MTHEIYFKVITFISGTIIWIIQQSTFDKALENSPMLALVLGFVYIFMKIFDFFWDKVSETKEESVERLIRNFKDQISNQRNEFEMLNERFKSLEEELNRKNDILDKNYNEIEKLKKSLYEN